MNPKESLPKDIIADINELSNSSLQLLLEETLNRIMKSEREIYLSSNDDYANGYIERGLGTPL
ncbi:MAG: hypothetical protein AB7T10_00105 [bacterium]